MPHKDSASYPDSKKPFRQVLGGSTKTGSDLVETVDAQTNVKHLRRGESGQSSIRDLGPVVQAVVPVDERGNVGKVSAAGSLHVVQVAAGLPFYKNAITGSDAWVLVFKVNRECHHLAVGAETSGLQVGLKLPGTGNVFAIAAVVSDANAADNMRYDGLLIPAGSGVYVINQVNAANAANGFVCVW